MHKLTTQCFCNLKKNFYLFWCISENVHLRHQMFCCIFHDIKNKESVWIMQIGYINVTKRVLSGASTSHHGTAA